MQIVAKLVREIVPVRHNVHANLKPVKLVKVGLATVVLIVVMVAVLTNKKGGDIVAIGVSNQDTVTLHITDKCNLRCKYCYQRDYPANNMTIEIVRKVVEKINPKGFFLYGGEPLLNFNLIKQIAKEFPDIKLSLETNGTMLTSEIMKVFIEHNVKVFITLESFIYEHHIIKRPMPLKQFDNIINSIGGYMRDADILIIKNIFLEMNDFWELYTVANEFNIQVDTFPIVDMTSCDLEHNFFTRLKETPSNVIDYMRAERIPTVAPKLRVLTDGTVTRDMRGIHNICQIDNFTPMHKGVGDVPMSEKCMNCKYFGRCFSCNIFPHFCKDVVETVENPFCCKLTEYLWEKL